jgi:hypothetical protein
MPCCSKFKPAVQGGVSSESLIRVLLTVRPLQGQLTVYLLEHLVSLPGDEHAMDADVDDRISLAKLILTQLEALDVGVCSDEVLTALLEAFEATAPQLQGPLANIIGEMVPAHRTAGASPPPTSQTLSELHRRCTMQHTAGTTSQMLTAQIE